jgi:ribonuclease HI
VPNPRPGRDAPGIRGRPATFSGHIDGGARGNPGPAGAGIVLEEAGGGREEIFAYLGSATNNVAEYAALLCLLHRAVERNAAELTVHSDSELLVKQMLGTYRVRNSRLQAFHAAARRLMARIPKIVFRHVPREENREADLLANRAMDSAASSSPLPEEVARLLDAPVQGLLTLREEV